MARTIRSSNTLPSWEAEKLKRETRKALKQTRKALTQKRQEQDESHRVDNKYEMEESLYDFA